MCSVHFALHVSNTCRAFGRQAACLEEMKFADVLAVLAFQFSAFCVCFPPAAPSPPLSEGGGVRCGPPEEEVPEEAQAGVCGDPSAPG